ncbi:SMI1/KNR4 family protein [Streptomyces sp. NPDC021093]|uniref:SMI1/KNR4 family protein n=1 Tax=Streptomyces sp. NPDC021093 TaxID=3365112 RepID=UPI0037A1F04E
MKEMEALQQLMPPPGAPDINGGGQWVGMSESWGKAFPSDYIRFMEIYGPGSIEDYLAILSPEPKDSILEQESGGMAPETATAQLTWATSRKSDELLGASPELIAWGIDSSADILCWDASEADSENWPVLVYHADDAQWRRYDCGVTVFLLGILQATLEECPLGEESLWGKASVKFLTTAEQLRLMRQGLDPWTGEPDPYAGMYDS